MTPDEKIKTDFKMRTFNKEEKTSKDIPKNRLISGNMKSQHFKV